MPLNAAQVIAHTRAWVERAVIALNLCPFAKAVQVKGQVRYVASKAASSEALLDELCEEIRLLVRTAAEQVDTTLLIHPQVLTDFGEFNDFLDVADAALQALGCEGVIQIASFHPHYRFAGTRPSDITNATNRSPYPTLHLLREASIERAVQAIAEPEAIYEANKRTLRKLGSVGWVALQAQCQADARKSSS